MNNIEQAYINGFLKRAAELGFSEEEASNLLDKIAGPTAAPKTMPQTNQAAAKPQIKLQPSVADKNDRLASKGNYVPKPLPNPKTIPLEY